MADPVKIGKYEILERIGRGGMGFVYRAVDPLLKREVALKTMLKDLSGDEELRSRFMREAQSAGGLRHPNIVTIYDLGEDDQHCPYIAMEFLTGTDIEIVIKNKTQLPLLKKLDIIIQTCNGLSYAHSKGIIHRDIKPANIRLLDNGEVKIMDFGIAKIAASHFTKTGMIMGTPHYMAPEQIRGEKVDGRADIFSLGVVLFELIAFRKPFPGDNPTAVLFKIIHSEPDRLQDAKFTPPEGLDELMNRALAKKPEERYQSCDEMGEDLLKIFDVVKQTEKVDPTLIIDKPFTTITVSRTPTPRKVTPIPRPSMAITPPPITAKSVEPPAPKTVVPEPAVPAATPPPAPKTETPLPSAKIPSAAASGSETRKWTIIAAIGLVGVALIAFLLFGLLRKVAMSNLVFQNVVKKPPHSTSQPAKQPPPVQTPETKEATPPPPPNQEVVTPETKPEEAKQEEAAVPAQQPGYVALNILPWAEIKEIKDQNGNTSSLSCTITPCKIQLPAGTYDISLYNAQFQATVVHIDIRSNETTLVNQKMEGFDYAKAIESLGF